MTEKKLAPWVDFAGAPIHEGDTIQHPSGEHGKVVFQPSFHEPGDQWRVRYDGTSDLSRLCLQIGVKGMAVVVRTPEYAHFGRGRSRTVTYANRHDEPIISSVLPSTGSHKVEEDQRLAGAVRDGSAADL